MPHACWSAHLCLVIFALLRLLCSRVHEVCEEDAAQILKLSRSVPCWEDGTEGVIKVCAKAVAGYILDVVQEPLPV
jgi:hypothetical protein